MVSPTARHVDIPIDNGFIGMVDREHFDAFLRDRAVQAGAELVTGTFLGIERDASGTRLAYRDKATGERVTLPTRLIIGADGARSDVARAEVPGGDTIPYVIAYHEIIAAPEGGTYDPHRCDVVYDGAISPDFYGWIFPHGAQASVGMGTGVHGIDLKAATGALRRASGLDGCRTIRKEGAPIPLKPLDRWDNGRDVVLAGDAAGVVAPSSGEGIYYAMVGGRFAAEAAAACLASGRARGPAARAQAIHGRAQDRVPGASRDAGRLLQVRRPARTLRVALPRRRCAAADFRGLHEQAHRARPADGAPPHHGQEHRPPHRARPGGNDMTDLIPGMGERDAGAGRKDDGASTRAAPQGGLGLRDPRLGGADPAPSAGQVPYPRALGERLLHASALGRVRRGLRPPPARPRSSASSGSTSIWRDRLEYRAAVGEGLTEHEVVDIFAAEAPADLRVAPDPSEVMATRWIDLIALTEEVAATPDRFTPWLPIYLERSRDRIFGAAAA